MLFVVCPIIESFAYYFANLNKTIYFNIYFVAFLITAFPQLASVLIFDNTTSTIEILVYGLSYLLIFAFFYWRLTFERKAYVELIALMMTKFIFDLVCLSYHYETNTELKDNLIAAHFVFGFLIYLFHFVPF